MKQTIYIIIPVFNEGSVIRSVIESIRALGYKNILIVDDGSYDATSEEVKKTKAMVIRHSINRGKGAAVKTGIEAAKALGATCVVTLDGDGQHDSRDIKRMLEYIRKGYDVVLGSRFLLRQRIPVVKRAGNFFANIIAQILYGLWVTDSQSGLRAYGKRAFWEIDTRSDRYEFDSEVIREIANKKLRYIEIPIRVHYTQYSQEKRNRQDIISALSSAIRIILLS